MTHDLVEQVLVFGGFEPRRLLAALGWIEPRDLLDAFVAAEEAAHVGSVCRPEDVLIHQGARLWLKLRFEIFDSGAIDTGRTADPRAAIIDGLERVSRIAPDLPVELVALLVVASWQFRAVTEAAEGVVAGSATGR